MGRVKKSSGKKLRPRKILGKSAVIPDTSVFFSIVLREDSCSELIEEIRRHSTKILLANIEGEFLHASNTKFSVIYELIERPRKSQIKLIREKFPLASRALP